jgi:hypothetical protein
VEESGAESLLKATLEAGLKLQAIKPSDLSRVNVDTMTGGIAPLL